MKEAERAFMAAALRFPAFLSVMLFLLATETSRALIIYGVDNSGNQTDPGFGNTWEAVAAIAKPTESVNASAVYLGGGYFLTAKHVTAVETGSQVKINGTNYSLDTSFGTAGIQLVEDLPGVIGPVDLKLFRVLAPPALAFVGLNTSDTLDLGTNSVLIGWGVGKGTEVPDQGWYWGDDTTRAKRWGESVTSSTGTPESLETVFDAAYGADAASLTLGDSGSGLFQQTPGGEWVLAGTSVDVEYFNQSFYNRGVEDPPNPDASGYVRISTYAPAIQSAIPEPGTLTTLFLTALAGIVFRRQVLRDYLTRSEDR